MKFKFYFDYIYYRMTKFYSKWDGSHGITSIIGVAMIQLLILLDLVVFLMRLLYDRDTTKNYIGVGKFIIAGIFIALIIYNYKKYKGSYDELKLQWENESKRIRIMKGFLVILSLLLPWAPIILIGIFM